MELDDEADESHDMEVKKICGWNQRWLDRITVIFLCV